MNLLAFHEFLELQDFVTVELGHAGVQYSLDLVAEVVGGTKRLTKRVFNLSTVPFKSIGVSSGNTESVSRSRYH
jgi:hypothetical protein